MKRARTAVLASLLGAAALVTITAAPDALATTDTTFDDFNVGSVNGQGGWVSLGSAGSGCATYDHAIVANGESAPEEFGTESLRISNAVTSGCFGDQTFSAPTAGEAGETSAESGGLSTGPRSHVFDASWSFTSTSSTEQEGLSVVVSPDRGDGARMSWIQMADGDDGLAVNFYDYQHDVEDFVFTEAVSGLARDEVHTVRVVMELLDGPENDVVSLFVDGEPVHVGTSWEDYFRDWEENETRTVDSLLFRTAGTAAPATTGGGFLIDNVSLDAEACLSTEVDDVITLEQDCVVTQSFLVPAGKTLDGDGYTITAVDPAGGHFKGAVVTNASTSSTINVIDLTVTADDLANACDGGDDRLRGILLDGAGGTIENNTVTGINQGESGCQEGNGIEVRNGPFDDTSDADTVVTIDGNTVTDYQKGGIVVNGSVDATITDNEVVGWGPTDAIAQNGIQVAFGASAFVQSNSVSDNYYTGEYWTSCGVLLYQADGVKVKATKYSGNQENLCNYGKGGGSVDLDA